MRLPLAALAAFLALPASAQTTWYVDVQGVPPGTGTVSDPFVSIQQAIDAPAVVAGDTLLVAPGVYAERVDAKAKHVTIRSQAGPAQTWIEPVQPDGDIGYVVVLSTSSISGSVLDGFTVSGAQCLRSVGIYGLHGTVRKCVITGHKGKATYDPFAGAGIFSDFDLWVERCTIVGNALGITCGYISAAYVSDSIVAHNKHDLEPSGLASASTFQHSLVETKTWGAGSTNLSGDPELWNPDQGDLQLGPLSPCIDAGNPMAPPDPDGSPRDMGALTFDPAHLPPTVTYCTAKLNSDGCTLDIGWSGGASASASAATPFVVTGQGVLPNTTGLLFYGFGRRAAPFMGGFHCVEPPTPRVGGQFSGSGGPCAGSFAFDFNAWVQSGADPLLVPGAVVDAQWWYRDPLDPLGFFSSTSDAIEFAIAP
jgi:hypothetical protein